ncbi:hypothetical protein PM082_016280 [Marasmius tenuissimus]|nr:hypothetical protein PM082_016280 [Marasmius tenuissimus]
MYSPAALCTGLALVVLISRIILYKRRSGYPLPPGPKRFPVVGNLRDPKAGTDEPRWVSYHNLARRYGEVVYTEVFGSALVILNSQKAVVELLEKRSSNFSDRPPMYMANDLVGLDWDLGHMRYSDRWRLHRRTFHQFFQLRATVDYRSVETNEARSFARKLIKSPEAYYRLTKHYIGAIILRLVYGYNLKEDDDPYLDLVDKAMAGFIATVNPGSFLVDHVPLLKYIPSWLPGAGFKRKAKEWAASAKDVRDVPWDWVKQSLATGTASPSFATQNIDRFSVVLGENSLMEDVIKNCAGIAYTAGSDTTASTLLSFILMMVVHPDAQARAHAEIDTVTRGTRLPDFSDQPELPFVQAILTETLRCYPPAPLGLAHACVNDEVHEGYFIPAGTTIVPNIWSILHDEGLYPDPMRFDPERFTRNDSPGPSQFVFGFGRRICPARHLALDSIWIAAVTLLAVFRVSKETNEDGSEIEPEVEYPDGLVTHPQPFMCRFIPRSDKIVELAE